MLRPLALAFGLLVLVPTVTFLLFALLPSDPIRLMVGINASEEAVARLRSELGYDRTLLLRLINFLWGVAHLDFGMSLVTHRPVAPDVFLSYLTTLGYVAGALVLGVALSLFLYFIAYFGTPSIQLGVLLLARSITGLPSLVIAIGAGLILLATGVSGLLVRADSRSLVMASLALAVYPTFSLTEIAILESQTAVRLQHVTATRSFGFSEWRIFWSHILRASLLPWLGHLSNIAASLVTGSIVIEIVFSLPGLGRLVVQSVLRNDFPMMQAVVVTSVLSFLALNFIAEQSLRRLFPAYR